MYLSNNFQQIVNKLLHSEAPRGWFYACVGQSGCCFPLVTRLSKLIASTLSARSDAMEKLNINQATAEQLVAHFARYGLKSARAAAIVEHREVKRLARLFGLR